MTPSINKDARVAKIFFLIFVASLLFCSLHFYEQHYRSLQSSAFPHVISFNRNNNGKWIGGPKDWGDFKRYVSGVLSNFHFIHFIYNF